MLTAPKTNSRCGDLKPEAGSPKLSVMFCATRFQAMRGTGTMIEKGPVLFLFQIWRASLYSAGSVNRLTTVRGTYPDSCRTKSSYFIWHNKCTWRCGSCSGGLFSSGADTSTAYRYPLQWPAGLVPWSFLRTRSNLPSGLMGSAAHANSTSACKHSAWEWWVLRRHT